MDANANPTHFWTAILGLVAAIVTLLATIGGTAGVFQGGGTTAGGQGTAPPSPPAEALTPTPTPIPTAKPATATSMPTPAIWQKGTLELPVEGENVDQAVDLDTDEIVRDEDEDGRLDADLAARVDGDEILLEPGLVSPDGGFYAWFVTVNDEPAGRNGCAAEEGKRVSSNSLQLSRDVEIGSHICLVTTEDRIAEFEIIGAKLTGRQRWLEIRYTT
ncbi:MAG TPA: hypothetical protein VFO59_03535, partial [Dehalococcoidia bacterium]|nr:hypothetical protein [Dehalococcoidia bacterium]